MPTPGKLHRVRRGGRKFPRVGFRQTTKREDLEAAPEWPEVIFGNVPAPVANFARGC